MATLQQLWNELEARRPQLKEAEDRGWYDNLPWCREIVSEFEYTFGKMLEANIGNLLIVAKDIEMGPLPSGIGLHYSTDGRQRKANNER